jgi:hypothetical protein
MTAERTVASVPSSAWDRTSAKLRFACVKARKTTKRDSKRSYGIEEAMDLAVN